MCDVMLYGAVPDGVSPCEKPIEHAIEDCAKVATREEPATVSFPVWIHGSENIYLTGPFNLSSYVKIRIDKGVILRAAPVAEDYPIIPALPSYGRNLQNSSQSVRLHPLIGGWGIQGAEVAGPGTLDGFGAKWWDRAPNGSPTSWLGGPSLIELNYCKDVHIHHLNILNPPNWAVHLFSSSDVTVEDLTVNATATALNTAGVVVDSSEHVQMNRLVIDVGDDGISVGVKSGLDFLGREFMHPVKHLAVLRSYLVQPFLVGPEICGGAQNLSLQHSTLGAPLAPVVNASQSAGVAVIDQRGCGGTLTDLKFFNLTIRGSLHGGVAGTVRGASKDGVGPLRVDMAYRSPLPPPTNRSATPRVDGIVFESIVSLMSPVNSSNSNNGSNSSLPYNAGTFVGLSESPILKLLLQDVDVQVLEGESWTCSHVSRAQLKGNVTPALTESGTCKIQPK